MASQPKVQSASADEIVDLIGGFFTGYGMKKIGKAIMQPDGSFDDGCGQTHITNIKKSFGVMYDTNMNTPCYTMP